MNNDNFKEKDFNCIQIWVTVDTEEPYLHVFKDIEEKEDEGEVAVEYFQRETPMHARSWEGINVLLTDGYEVNDDQNSEPENKPSNIGDTYQPI